MTTITLQDRYKIRRAVVRGADALDEKLPDWPTRINLSGLEMANPHSCILGQAFMHQALHPSESGWAVGVSELDLRIDGEIVESGAFGFDVHPDVSFDNEHWSFLAEEWFWQIKERLDEGVDLST